MKKFPFILILAAVLGGVFTSCFKDDDPADEYADWRIDNVAWYEEQAALSDYYTKKGIDPEPIVGKATDCDECHFHN